MENTAQSRYPQRDERIRKQREAITKVKMFIHACFWRVVFLLHINKLVAETMCRLNIYSKYGLGGRCQWCGEKHGLHWKIKYPDYGGLEKSLKEATKPI